MPSPSSSRTRSRSAPSLTLDLGLRYEWHVTPTERDNQFVVFDQDTVSLLRVGVDLDEIYRQNNGNVEPRARRGLDALARTVARCVRGAYGWAVDQPSTTAVRDTAGNPPFAIPLTATGSIALASAAAAAGPTGLAPATVDPQFRNASLQSWNVNVQQQLGRESGGDGRATSVPAAGNLRISRNLNQPVDGIRPFPALSTSSPIRPGAPLGNITQVESTGFSSYHALWVSATQRLARGLAVRRVVYLVEVARYQLAQLVRLRRPGRLRHSEPVRAVGLRRPPSIRAQRNLPAAVYRTPPGPAAGNWRPSSRRRAAIPSTSSPATARSTGCRTPCGPTWSDRSASSARWISGSTRRRSRPSIASAISAGMW